MIAYLWSIVVELDVLGCVLLAPLFRVLGVAPVEGMRISDVCAIAARDGLRWGCFACRILDWFSKDHCQQSLASLGEDAEAIESDLGNIQPSAASASSRDLTKG